MRETLDFAQRVQDVDHSASPCGPESRNSRHICIEARLRPAQRVRVRGRIAAALHHSVLPR